MDNLSRLLSGIKTPITTSEITNGKVISGGIYKTDNGLELVNNKDLFSHHDNKFDTISNTPFKCSFTKTLGITINRECKVSPIKLIFNITDNNNTQYCRVILMIPAIVNNENDSKFILSGSSITKDLISISTDIYSDKVYINITFNSEYERVFNLEKLIMPTSKIDSITTSSTLHSNALTAKMIFLNNDPTVNAFKPLILANTEAHYLEGSKSLTTNFSAEPSMISSSSVRAVTATIPNITISLNNHEYSELNDAVFTDLIPNTNIKISEWTSDITLTFTGLASKGREADNDSEIVYQRLYTITPITCNAIKSGTKTVTIINNSSHGISLFGREVVPEHKAVFFIVDGSLITFNTTYIGKYVKLSYKDIPYGIDDKTALKETGCINLNFRMPRYVMYTDDAGNYTWGAGGTWFLGPVSMTTSGSAVSIISLIVGIPTKNTSGGPYLVGIPLLNSDVSAVQGITYNTSSSDLCYVSGLFRDNDYIKNWCSYFDGTKHWTSAICSYSTSKNKAPFFTIIRGLDDKVLNYKRYYDYLVYCKDYYNN